MRLYVFPQLREADEHRANSLPSQAEFTQKHLRTTPGWSVEMLKPWIHILCSESKEHPLVLRNSLAGRASKECSWDTRRMMPAEIMTSRSTGEAAITAARAAILLRTALMALSHCVRTGSKGLDYILFRVQMTPWYTREGRDRRISPHLRLRRRAAAADPPSR